MRIALFVLMIVLLPLRGWVGDAMATSMATAQLGTPQRASAADATKFISKKAEGTWTRSTFDAENEVLTVHQHADDAQAAAGDCAGHAAPHHAGNSDGSGNGHDNENDSDACGSCAACVACHLSAIQPSTPLVQAFSTPRFAPLLGQRNFASADAALSQKPPIS